MVHRPDARQRVDNPLRIRQRDVRHKGETISLAIAGGKGGAYLLNSHVSPRYSATARNIIGKVTTVGAAGTTGRTRMTVIYALPKVKAATKV